MKPGAIFNLMSHAEHEDIEIFMCEDLDNKGNEFWLSRGFVLGEFEEGYTPLCWTQDLFIVI
jgi:hypothetical protein